MKIAVMSDIHGFSLALDRVLEDVASVPGISATVLAGDLCEGGPDPRGVYDRVRRMNAFALQGNTDRDIGTGVRTSALAKYTMEQLGKDGRAWLKNRPFSKRFSPPGEHDESKDVLVCHANPFDMDRAIRPDADEHELTELIGTTQAAVIAFGHIHISYTREWNGMTLFDVSAVGNSRDGDISARWGLIEWNESEHRWDCSLRKVPYPIDETEEQMRTCGMPNVDKHIKKLRKATY